MERLEVSGAVRPIYGSLGIKRLKTVTHYSSGKLEVRIAIICEIGVHLVAILFRTDR